MSGAEININTQATEQGVPTPGLVLDTASGRWRIICRGGRKAGRVYYYRAVMEAHLGRELRSDEHVHHINGDCSDDRLENLELIDPSSHGAKHGAETWIARKAGWEYPWSRWFANCLICGTTERPHAGYGRCSRCDSRIRYRTKRLGELVEAAA